MLDEAIVEIEVVDVDMGGFLVQFWKALDGFMWKAKTQDEIGDTFGPFGDPETAVASAWQWLKEGNLS